MLFCGYHATHQKFSPQKLFLHTRVVAEIQLKTKLQKKHT